MSLNTVGLATLIWILMLFIFLVIINCIFYCFRGKRRSVEVGSAPPEPIRSPVKKQEPRAELTRYAVRDSVEVAFNDEENNRFYSTCVNDAIIKVTTIWSLNGDQEKIAYNETYSIVNADDVAPVIDDVESHGATKAEETPRVVELAKPTGLLLAENPHGEVYVEAIEKNSPAEQSGMIFVGDFICKMSANVGEELWNCETIGLQSINSQINLGTAPTVRFHVEAATPDEESKHRRLAFANQKALSKRKSSSNVKDLTANLIEEEKSFTVRCVTVPLNMATYVECEAAQYSSISIWSEGRQSPNSHIGELISSGFDYCKRLFRRGCYLIMKYMILPLNVIFLFALVMCFYIPGYQALNGNDKDSYDSSKTATTVLFVCTLVALCLHGVYLYALHRSKQAQNSIRLGSWITFLLLIVVFSLACNLFAISNGSMDASNGSTGQSAAKNSSSSSTSIAYSFDRFTCGCPDTANNQANNRDSDLLFPSEVPTLPPGFNGTITQTPSRLPTTSPTLSPTRYLFPNDYEFECSAELFYNAKGDYCEANCGVCGSTYRDPFLSYAVLGGMYFAMICILMHYEFYIADQLDIMIPSMEKTKKVVKINASDLIVTVHGSRVFGYPIHTKMSLVDYLPFEERINELVQSDKDRKSGDILMHFANTGSYSNRRKPRGWFS